MELLNNLVAPFPFLTVIDYQTVQCNICQSKQKCYSKGDLDKHFYSKKHINNAKLQSAEKSEHVDITFAEELCELLVSCGIPFWKLKNEHFRGFLQKYCERPVPCESTVRMKLNTVYSRKISAIYNELRGKYIWLSTDETTDALGRSVVNVIVGTLQPSSACKAFLVLSEVVEKVNYDIIAKLLSKVIDTLLTSSEKSEKVLLLVTDAAPYMLKAGRTIQTFLPNMIHMTCLAHTLHRICEYVREQFDDVNDLIAYVKAIFVKAPSRRTYYKEMCPSLPLPPQPVVTRWGTWISACKFYCEHFITIKSMILSLEDSSKCIKKCKELVQNKPTLEQHLQFINDYFGFLPETIKLLETRDLPLTESLQIFNNAIEKLEYVPDEFGIKKYIHGTMSRNPGYEKLEEIASLLKKSESKEDAYNAAQNYRFAPITSCDVERTFSSYKDILSSTRHSFTTEHLSQYIIISCNK